MPLDSIRKHVSRLEKFDSGGIPIKQWLKRNTSLSHSSIP